MVATEISDNPMDVLEALRLVDLEDRADHFPSQMSGGRSGRGPGAVRHGNRVSGNKPGQRSEGVAANAVACFVFMVLF